MLLLHLELLQFARIVELGVLTLAEIIMLTLVAAENMILCQCHAKPFFDVLPPSVTYRPAHYWLAARISLNLP